MARSSSKTMLWLLLTVFASLAAAGAGRGDDGRRSSPQVYVVYMGAVPPRTSPDLLLESHLRLLGTVLKRGRRADSVVVHQYKHGFSGFAARLSKDEVAALRRKPGVVSVFADPVYQLHTTRSWDFLQQTTTTAVKIDDSAGRARRSSNKNNGSKAAAPADDPSSSSLATDTIIGLLDSGIWPESPSFNDAGFGRVPSRWKGVCMTGDDFNSSNCNNKLIGARYYDLSGVGGPSPSDGGSPRDDVGHGTHTSSTAAGNAVTGASYYGLAPGTAKGGSTGSRVAMYRVCAEPGCSGSAILAGFDDAIADGVDVVSVSLGASPFFRPDFSADPIAIGAFHAVAKGVMVVCSAGNSGPDAATVVNAAPWILTVAATTIDRDFESDVVLGGNNSAVKGVAINFSNLDRSPKYPLITGAAAKSSSVSDTDSASHCEPGTLDSSKIRRKIVLCHHSQSDTSKLEKADELQSSGAAGCILVNDAERSVATAYLDLPVTEVTSAAAAAIHKYIASASQPVATITPATTVTEYKPAPVVAYFSSRGPSGQTGNILKPDIAAPGVNILASWIPPSSLPPGQKQASQFNLVSGTSMACPHVAGAAATVKAWNPTWSPAAIRSAIMTTATTLNNERAPMTTDSGSAATPYDLGAGQVHPTGALDPGLVYDAGEDDYLRFLCNYGYNASTVRLIAGSALPGGFSCAANASKDLISDLNYPSIAVSGLLGKATSRTVTVTRAVTNVGAQEAATYTVAISAPAGLNVKVTPSKLEFTRSAKKLAFQVTFSRSGNDDGDDDAAAKGALSGSITWSDGKHLVRSPFVVTS
ncbi:LOW QUALITY PROTEIN: CO(2)-response secreted protease-like [Miscanthus floridulus]|uniref:LOW QUALITY PROTEIN: CO(2)-response secreted protease-like n=1 Tax=Miscanthus floridulus TaxID=154761 RepID=UPI003458E43E